MKKILKRENPDSKPKEKPPKKSSKRKNPDNKSTERTPKQNSLPESQKQDSLPEPPNEIFSPEKPKCKSIQEKPKKRFLQKKPVLILIGILIVISTMIISSYALFSGSHNLFTNKTNAQDFCNKCHPDKVTIMNLASNAHTGAGCICHGYNPNATETFNINVAHNLTKNIYCTNCHTNYNSTTGNIMIHSGTIAAPNQSAHYLINNSNKNIIYQNAQGFFNNSKR